MALDSITSGQDLGTGGAEPQGLPTAPAPTSTEATPSNAGASEQQLYEVKADGITQKVPLQELIRGYQRQSTWTRKTQELAEQRKVLGDNVAEFQRIVRDRDRIRAYYREMFGEDIGNAQATAMARGAAPQPGASVDPQDLLTRTEVEQLMSQREKQLREELRNEMTQGISQVEEARLTEHFRGMIRRKMGEIYQEYPELQKIPGIEEDLKAAAKSHVPQSAEEMLHLLTEYAGIKAQAIRELTRGAVTSSATAKATVERGILPPGGTVAPQPPAERFRSVKDPRLKEQVLRDLLSMED